MDKLETIKSVLQGFDFTPERIAAAVAALDGRDAPNGQPEHLMTPKELCACLKISATTLWRMRPPHHWVGGRKRYVLPEVLAALKTSKGSTNHFSSRVTKVDDSQQ